MFKLHQTHLLNFSDMQWYKAEISLSLFSGGQALDAIAIDDVNVQDKPCETGYFVINNYAELLETASPGDYLYGPVMYTDDGYAYQILVRTGLIIGRKDEKIFFFL